MKKKNFICILQTYTKLHLKNIFIKNILYSIDISHINLIEQFTIAIKKLNRTNRRKIFLM